MKHFLTTILFSPLLNLSGQTIITIHCFPGQGSDYAIERGSHMMTLTGAKEISPIFDSVLKQ